MARIAMSAPRRVLLAPVLVAALLVGCEDTGTAEPTGATLPASQPPPAPKPGEKPQPAQPPAPPPAPKVRTEKVKISGKTFTLEVAADDVTRFRGLSGRTEIPAEGGMIFLFPKPQRLDFVMRDCPVDIDIIFLGADGRVTATHAMKAEPPRAADEMVNDPRTGVNAKYEARLKKYPSRFDAQFVIELKGGTLAQLNLKSADKLDLDLARLKKMAK
ncbi:MAG: DUF192 domain-containing protein [Planctomycetota bacterium]|nr:DUF192 domain-containing protein [Planctomycetota bacterium]